MPSMAIDGAEITSDVLPAMPRPFFGGARGSRRAEPRRRSPAPAGLHLLPQARRRPRAALRRLLAQDRFHRLSALHKARHPLPHDTGEPSLSAAAVADPPVYYRARAAARYSSTMRDLIQSFKYGDRHEGVPLFGRWMAAAGAELLADAEIIVPVPLYRSRHCSRRFNQSAMLAQEVGKLTGVPVDCFLLARVKRTPSQVGLTAAQRRKNVAGAFRVTAAKGALREKRIVVVDDVIKLCPINSTIRRGGFLSGTARKTQRSTRSRR